MLENHTTLVMLGASLLVLYVLACVVETMLARIHRKLDHIIGLFEGLRLYLYEIDPQFDDEREAERQIDEEEGKDEPGGNWGRAYAIVEKSDLRKRKESEGKRTLRTKF